MASLYSTYTKKELTKKLKKQRLMVILKAIVIFLMVLFSIYYTVEEGIAFFTFLPLFFIPMWVIMIVEMKNIKKELISRK